MLARRILRAALKEWVWLKLRDRVPKPPRGYANPNDQRPSDTARRVYARLGARDEAGVRLLLARRGLSIDALIAQLNHFRPARRIRERLRRWTVRRSYGAKDYDPSVSMYRRARRAGLFRRRHVDLQIVKRVEEGMKLYD